MQLTNCESLIYITCRESFEFYKGLVLFFREFR